MTTSRGPLIHQHDSHAQLIGPGTLDPADGEPHPVLDAIVVPASRLAHNLEHAITLARAVRCHLVILGSRETRAADVRDLLAARSFTNATVAEVPSDYRHKFFAFSTTSWVQQNLPAACAVRDSDLSTKRNIGLILARMLEWRRIFFLDDDIRDLDAATLTATVSLVANDESRERHYYTAGISADEFPDNSVVCHARRAIGESQGVFVSGSALAVDCTVPFRFFPHIYNEDWLFFYQDVREGRLGSLGHTATQLRYDPFANPQRAAAEEFGDVIAEGLYALLEDDFSIEAATAERWRQFLDDRMRILNEIIDHADMALLEVRAKMIEAVETARACLVDIKPAMCVKYIRLWRQDLGQWERTLKEVPRMASIHDALAALDL